MRGAIPPFPQYVFMAWCLDKHRDDFTFIFKRVFRRKDWFQDTWLSWKKYPRPSGSISVTSELLIKQSLREIWGILRDSCDSKSP
jgi:hypothetical protein